MKILGIDPGYERVGIAVIEKPERGKETLLYSDCFKTSKHLSLAERISLIGAEITRLITEFSPQILATEKLFFSKNVKTAMGVAEARGVIIEKGSSQGLTISEFGPMEIKQAITGSGSADKKQMIVMIPRLVSMKEKKGRHDDEYDAIAVALTCSATQKFTEKLSTRR